MVDLAVEWGRVMMHLGNRAEEIGTRGKIEDTLRIKDTNKRR